jgi:hypothetical protein
MGIEQNVSQIKFIKIRQEDFLSGVQRNFTKQIHDLRC